MPETNAQPKWPPVLISSLLAVLVSLAGLSFMELRKTGTQITATTATLNEVVKRLDRRDAAVNERLRRLEDRAWPTN